MPTTEDYLNSLKRDKQNIINNIKAKGVNVPNNATFTDLVGKVESIPAGVTPTGTIDITTNGITDVTDYASANVNVPDGADKYFDYNNYNKGQSITAFIKTIPYIDLSNSTSTYRMFAECTNLKEVPLLNTANVTNMQYMFLGCRTLERIPLLDTSKVTNMRSMFENCREIKEVPLLNTVNVTDIQNMFYYCFKLYSIPLLNTSKVINMNKTFYQAWGIRELAPIDTSNVLYLNYTFYDTNLKTMPELNLQSAISIDQMMSKMEYLENFGGFKNLGMAYPVNSSSNSYAYTLNLSYSPNLTHESLMNVINNLYDIKTKGVKPQKLQLGSTNLAKLTPDEIAIATNKGWNVS